MVTTMVIWLGVALVGLCASVEAVGWIGDALEERAESRKLTETLLEPEPVGAVVPFCYCRHPSMHGRRCSFCRSVAGVASA